MKYENFPWLILFLPLLSAAVITLFTLRSKTVSSLISIGAVAAGFVLTCLFVNANGIHFSGETSDRTGFPSAACKCGLRPQARCVEHDDVVRRHRRRRLDPYLFLQLHGRRCGQGALFRVLEFVHVLDARHRAGEQFSDDLHFLGTRRRVQLPAHRFLV